MQSGRKRYLGVELFDLETRRPRNLERALLRCASTR
jgi:hypothetical protein